MSYRDAKLARAARRAVLCGRLNELAAEEAVIRVLRRELCALDVAERRHKWLGRLHLPLWLLAAVSVPWVLLYMFAGPLLRRPDPRTTAEVRARELRHAGMRRMARSDDRACLTLSELVAAGEIDLQSGVEDPWGTPYRIACYRDEHGALGVTVTSAGPDRKHATADDIVG